MEQQDINRAYITVDNKLFLWNYHDGGDFQMYQELTQIIVSVGLVRPKAGVFPPKIKFVLVLATPVDIVMVGLHFERNIHGPLTLYSSTSALRPHHPHCQSWGTHLH
jgi:nuclear pore complex protein Nup155